MSSDTSAPPMPLVKYDAMGQVIAEAIDIFSIAVHPDADLFPMIPDDEMAELVEGRSIFAAIMLSSLRWLRT